jgi:uncharacterized protein
MRLALESNSELNLIRRYSDTEIVIGDATLKDHCIVAPRSLVAQWSAPALKELDVVALAPALALQPQILLLGCAADSAASSRALPPLLEMRRELRARSIGLEVMELGAACRTYNVLASEGRDVVAALLLRRPPREDTGRRSSFQPPIIRS